MRYHDTDEKNNNMIIGIVNQKGGCGKTTLVTNLACLSAVNKKKTLLIDADIQGSSMKFRMIRPDKKPQFRAVSILTPTIHKDIRSFNFDVAFIDSGGRDSKSFRSVIRACDKVVVPIQPSQYDIWSSEETFEIMDEIRQFKEIEAGIVLNQLIQNTNISNEIIDLVEELSKKYNLKNYKTRVFSRVAYKESSIKGLSVVEIKESKYKKAKEEILSLYNEVFYG